jgi:hypothetical protein
VQFITGFKITDVDENKGKLDGYLSEPVLFDLSSAALKVSLVFLLSVGMLTGILLRVKSMYQSLFGTDRLVKIEIHIPMLYQYITKGYALVRL